ncbi:MAG: hypothetical protein ABIQ06_06080 [Caldimonas sp.]
MTATPELLGYAAAALVFLTFSLRSITALRAMAIVSNLMFIAYALAAHLGPVLMLHLALLPLNLWRLAELRSGAGARRMFARGQRSDVRMAAVDPVVPDKDTSHVFRRRSPCPVVATSPGAPDEPNQREHRIPGNPRRRVALPAGGRPGAGRLRRRRR